MQRQLSAIGDTLADGSAKVAQHVITGVCLHRDRPNYTLYVSDARNKSAQKTAFSGDIVSYFRIKL